MATQINRQATVVTDRFKGSERFRRTVLSMLEVIEAEETSQADRKRAVSTIRDALTLYGSEESFGIPLNRLEISAASLNRSEDYSASLLDSQEAQFANKLSELMKARAITQTQLASRVGCTQPAISQMLKRECRPQRSTILNLAAALDVDPRELWPNLDVTDILDTVAVVQEDTEMNAAEADAIQRALDSLPAKAPARALPSRKK